MELIVDLDSPVPVYEQLRAQVTELVEGGALPPDYTLPSVRRLSAELGVAPGTVARAYRELATAGLVACSRATGTRVAERPVFGAVERQRRLNDAANRMVGSARRIGASDVDITGAVTRALRETD